MPTTAHLALFIGSANRKRILEEIKKCELVCEDCHMTEHYGEGFRDCGTVRAYKRGCRCDECREANAAQSRRYRALRRR